MHFAKGRVVITCIIYCVMKLYTIVLEQPSPLLLYVVDFYKPNQESPLVSSSFSSRGNFSAIFVAFCDGVLIQIHLRIVVDS